MFKIQIKKNQIFLCYSNKICYVMKVYVYIIISEKKGIEEGCKVLQYFICITKHFVSTDQVYYFQNTNQIRIPKMLKSSYGSFPRETPLRDNYHCTFSFIMYTNGFCHKNSRRTQLNLKFIRLTEPQSMTAVTFINKDTQTHQKLFYFVSNCKHFPTPHTVT